MTDLKKKEATCAENTTASEYGFYSRVLEKVFNTVEELKEAEDAEKKAQEARAEAAKNKKADSVKVEEAFKALNAAKRDYNKNVLAAKKDYLKKKADLDTAYNAVVTEYADAIEVQETAYNKAVEEFTKKHPEGYHVTLRDGDNVVTLSKETRGIRPIFTSSCWDDIFNLLSRF